MPTLKISTVIILKRNKSINSRFFLACSEIFYPTNAYCLVVRYVDKQIYFLDQRCSK